MHINIKKVCLYDSMGQDKVNNCFLVLQDAVENENLNYDPMT